MRNWVAVLVVSAVVALGGGELRAVKAAEEDSISGIGAAIKKRETVLMVEYLVVGGPAEAAGLMSGDQILRIDGNAVAALSLEEAAALLRGEPHSVVRLEILRNGSDVPVNYQVMRKVFQVAGNRE